ncbi:hypothetical protein [Methanoregula sp. UBA64]|jgi:hypothetical protein|uniref:DUF350 domain-containing protein n=1 Tax=Methanoregula sp. UBA64 TaxID=1915554 RepID=UPI0025E5628B|nr:hypothetical protein [Methanoregula sp. UBA64]
MVTMDWTNIGIDALALVVTFIITTILAAFFLWLIDMALNEVDFLTMRDDPKAQAIASLGWLILYALVFAGAFIAPFSLDGLILREIVWTFVMLLVASVLTIISVKFISPYMRYCGKDGLQGLGKDRVATSLFYLGLCILIGVISFSALTA